MYTSSYLSRYPYFQQALSAGNLRSLHDSLTGVIARPFMLGFIQDLVAREIPFTLGILDLDNFKQINDHYGHKAGDDVLANIALDLKNFFGEDGLVGRFGGDEFLFVYLKSVDYDEVHTLFLRLFEGETSLRKELPLCDSGRHFLTATIGSAFFPHDAPDLDSLFSLIDKALYRGKSKGRNCFIMYVAAKHAQLQIPGLSGNGVYETLREMALRFDAAAGFTEKMLAGYAPFQNAMHLGKLLYLRRDLTLLDPETGEGIALARGIDFRGGDIYTPPVMEELAVENPGLYAALCGLGVEAVLFARIGREEEEYGGLVICPLPYTKHIWQDSEYTLAYSLCRMLAQYHRYEE